MSVKPRNFDKNVENQLLKQGVCTQEILSKNSEKEKKFFFNQLYIGSVGRRAHPYSSFAFSVYSYERRKHIRKRLARTVLIFTESSDQLSRATDRVPGLPASPGYAQ